MISKLRIYLKFIRPFTIIVPALGMVVGGLIALSAHPREAVSHDGVFLYIALGAFAAALLAAAANGFNQYCDREIDRLNKPDRPLPTGALTPRTALIFAVVLYVAALTAAWSIQPGGRRECFWIVSITAAITYLYSAYPFRLKERGVAANIAIAVPRGLLLVVAGWSTVRTIVALEPWFMGAIFGLYLLGASSTKDLSDLSGDREARSKTLFVQYGLNRSLWIIAPFFALPWLLMPLGSHYGLLSGSALILSLVGLGLFLWGLYTIRLMLKYPDRLSIDGNHISWKHMYLMMIFAQVGLIGAYAGL